MRIVIADCQSRVRFALRTLLKRQDGLEVVGEAATAAELLEQVKLTQPDLLLLHWRLQETAPGLMRRLQSLCPGLRVIALSARCETRSEALRAGAEAFVWKTEQPERLLAAITACGPAGQPEGCAGPDAVNAGDRGRRQLRPALAPGHGSV
jgi:DNA-binding NarL/FixJ family response regulator